MPWKDEIAAKPHSVEPWAYAFINGQPVEHDIAEVSVKIDYCQRGLSGPLEILNAIPRFPV